jgi:hypothetical protein
MKRAEDLIYVFADALEVMVTLDIISQWEVSRIDRHYVWTERFLKWKVAVRR